MVDWQSPAELALEGCTSYPRPFLRRRGPDRPCLVFSRLRQVHACTCRTLLGSPTSASSFPSETRLDAFAAATRASCPFLLDHAGCRPSSDQVLVQIVYINCVLHGEKQVLCRLQWQTRNSDLY